MKQHNISQEAITEKRDYNGELLEAENAISDALMFIQRARKVIVHLESTYFANDFPDAEMSFPYLNMEDKSEKAALVKHWCYDHNKIDDFMEIVFKYLIDAEIVLGRAVNIDTLGIE